jgi:hypothetical protein
LSEFESLLADAAAAVDRELDHAMPASGELAAASACAPFWCCIRPPSST